MAIPLDPPTPIVIEHFSIDNMFADPLINELFIEIKLAFYYMANPAITTIQKQVNWNGILNRMKLTTDQAINLRRNAQRPQVEHVGQTIEELKNRLNV